MASQPFAERFGLNLARLRRAADLSQEELGVRAGMHRTAVGQIERGERVARSDSLVKLSASLRVDPCLLLVGLSWRPATYEPGSYGISEADPSEMQDESSDSQQETSKKSKTHQEELEAKSGSKAEAQPGSPAKRDRTEPLTPYHQPS
jgi:transcriptional regulator with XRE-family HTH domain